MTTRARPPIDLPSAARATALRGTLLLALLGAVVGAVVGTALLSSLLAGAPHHLTWLDVQLGALFGGSLGALSGALGAPLLGWLVLRPVPLGRAIVATALGTLVGAWVAGAAWRTSYVAPIVGGLVGFVAGAVAIRMLTTRGRRGLDADRDAT